MSTCPTCGHWWPPDPETGYDADDFCSPECEEKMADLYFEIWNTPKGDSE